MKSFFKYVLKNSASIILLVLILSVVGYYISLSVPKGVFPNVFFPRVEVSVSNGYLPTEQMLVKVTKTIEEATKSIQHVERVISNTSMGHSELSIYFDWNIDPYRAYELVSARMGEVRGSLPPGSEVVVRQVTPSIYPVAVYAVVSDTLSRQALTRLLYYTIRPAILSVKGVYDAEMRGALWEEYWVVLSPSKLAQYDVTGEYVAEKIRQQNLIDFAGLVKDYGRQYVLTFYQQPKNFTEILDIPIPLKNNKYISLSQLALSFEHHEPILDYVKIDNHQNAVLFNLLRQPNANSIEVVKEVDRKVAELNKQLPEGVKIGKYYDLTYFTKKSVRSIIEAITLGALIILLVIFLFLRQIRMAIFTIFVIPADLLITLIAMKLLKIDLNIFSLGGMAASVGALVDQAMVVMENIERHLTKTSSRLEVVVSASVELLPPMSLATFTSILVFVPLVFLSGIVGVFFKQLAFTLASAIIISQILAAIFTPVLAYIGLSSKGEKLSGFEKLREKYGNALSWTLKRSWISIPLAFSIILGSFLLYRSTPTNLLPKWDEGSLVLDFVTPIKSSLEQTIKEGKRIEKVLEKIPEIEHYSLRIGTSLGHIRTAPVKGDFLIILKDKRKRSVFQIMDELRKKVPAAVPNLWEFDLTQVLEDRLGDIMGAEAPIKLELYGRDPERLIEYGKMVRDKLRKREGLVEVNLKTNFSGPQIEIKTKPYAYSRYGITSEFLKSEILKAYWGEKAGDVLKGEQIIPIRIALRRGECDPLLFLHSMFVFSPKLSKLIPIRYVANFKYRDFTPEVTHENLVPIALVTARFRGNDMGKAVSVIRETMKRTKLPEGITYNITGFYKEQQKSFKNLTFIMIISILLIFIALLFQFSDFSIAVSLIVGTVLSLLGVFLALFITKRPIDVTSFMGMLIVLSVVLNNGILVFHYYKKYANQGDARALFHASKVRMRPILMTLFADFFGFLPIAFAMGTGTEIIQGLAISVMGGLLFAIFMSLFMMPSIFVLLKRK